jgi:hypothetical protein
LDSEKETEVKRKETKPLTKHTLNLYEGQAEKLQTLHPRLGAAYVIRKLIDKHIGDAEAQAALAVPVPKMEVNIEELK